jgi:hyperosmotically inducible periplasmic protein
MAGIDPACQDRGGIMADRRIIEERQDYDDGIRPRIIGGDPNRRGRVSRHTRIIRDVRRPSFLSILLGLLIAGALGAGFYYYSYGNRSLDADFSDLRSTSKDAATTAAVKAAFSLKKQIDSGRIDVDTSSGVVTLKGQVDSEENRQVAERVARNTRGVSQVVNNIAISPTGQDQEKIKSLEQERASLSSQTDDLSTKSRVLEALLGTEALKGQQIKVEVVNRVATLGGVVDNQQQKDIAIATAQNISGVTEVKADQLLVRYQQAVDPLVPPSSIAPPEH